MEPKYKYKIENKNFVFDCLEHSCCPTDVCANQLLLMWGRRGEDSNQFGNPKFLEPSLVKYVSKYKRESSSTITKQKRRGHKYKYKYI